MRQCLSGEQNRHRTPSLILSRQEVDRQGRLSHCEGLARSILRCLSAFTEQEQGAANFDTVTTLERIAPLHRLAIH